MNNLNSLITNNLTKIKLGTILKGWHNSRGRDYMIVGIDKTKNKIYAVNHNCVNNSGKIRSNTIRHHRSFDYYTLTNSKTAYIKGITSVLGEKEQIDERELNLFNASQSSSINTSDFSSINLYTDPLYNRAEDLNY